MKKALVTGCCGQTGSYLAEILVEKGYEVIGVDLRVADTQNLGGLGTDKFKLVTGDIEDFSFLMSLPKVDEIYNMAALSHVHESFKYPIKYIQTNCIGLTNILELAKLNKSKILHASSSEMFGDCLSPQNSRTRLKSDSPYAATKVFGHHMINVYREAYNMFAISSTSFNHESSRRFGDFVTQKIVRAAVRIKFNNKKGELRLGNTDSLRDWSHAEDIANAYYLMMQKDLPRDYVIGSGDQYSILEFVEKVFAKLDLEVSKHVKTHCPEFLRPIDVTDLKADICEIRVSLPEWKPKYNLDDIINEMIEAEKDSLYD